MARSMAVRNAMRYLSKPSSGTSEFVYEQKKKGKLDTSKGTEREQWEETFGQNWANWDEEEYKRKKIQHDEYMRIKYGD